MSGKSNFSFLFDTSGFDATWNSFERKTPRKSMWPVEFSNFTREVFKRHTLTFQTSHVDFGNFTLVLAYQNRSKMPLFYLKMGDFPYHLTRKKMFVAHYQYVAILTFLLVSLTLGTGRAFSNDSQRLEKRQRVSRNYVLPYTLSNRKITIFILLRLNFSSFRFMIFNYFSYLCKTNIIENSKDEHSILH